MTVGRVEATSVEGLESACRYRRGLDVEDPSDEVNESIHTVAELPFPND